MTGKLLDDPDLQDEGEDRSKDLEIPSLWVVVKMTRLSRKSEVRMRSRAWDVWGSERGCSLLERRRMRKLENYEA